MSMRVAGVGHGVGRGDQCVCVSPLRGTTRSRDTVTVGGALLSDTVSPELEATNSPTKVPLWATDLFRGATSVRSSNAGWSSRLAGLHSSRIGLLHAPHASVSHQVVSPRPQKPRICSSATLGGVSDGDRTRSRGHAARRGPSQAWCSASYSTCSPAFQPTSAHSRSPGSLRGSGAAAGAC
jgi:hypothetical protein